MPILKNSLSGYTPTTWENKKTKLNATNMNNIEAGIQEAKASAIDAVDKALEAKNLVASKQDKLTAGRNITIDENNIISSQGGSLYFDDLALYTKYGVFRINGEAYNVEEVGNEVILPVGATYELSGYLKDGHIFVKSDDPENETKCTQLIFNGLYIKSDTPRAVYFNQTKKKVAIKLMANTDNNIYAGEYDYTPEEAEGAIQAEGNLVITSDKDSYLYIKSANINEQHAIKASRLYLSGAGLIEVYSKHDGFHGGKLLRVDSGNYRVDHAEVDGFEAKYLQIFGGNIEVANCYGDAISSKEERGLIAGYTAKINTAGNINNIDILETVPEVIGTTPISLENYFGEAIIKESTTRPVGDFPMEEELADWTPVTLVDGKYTTSKLYVYTKGYFVNPIVFSVAKSKYFSDNTCIKTSEEASIKYTTLEKKLECKAKEDSLLLVINDGDGDAIKSNSSVGLQENGNYIFKAADGYAINNINYLFTKGDGIKQLLSDKASVNAARFTIGADHADIAEDAKEDMFEAGSVFVNNAIKLAPNSVAYCDGKLYYAYGQIGAVEVADTNVTDTVKFWKENLNVIQTEKSAVIIKTKEDKITVDAYSKAESDERYVLKSDYDAVVNELSVQKKKINNIEDHLVDTLYPTYPKITFTANNLNPIVVRGKDGVISDAVWVKDNTTVTYHKDGIGYIDGDGNNAQFNIVVDCADNKKINIETTYEGDKPYKNLASEDYIENGEIVVCKKRVKATKVTGSFSVKLTEVDL